MKNDLKITCIVRTSDLDIKGKKVTLPCDSIEQAPKVFRTFLILNDLGASRCHEAFIMEGKSKKLRISYNGRLWNMDGTEYKNA